MSSLCIRCKERPGAHPRWDGATGTVLVCEECQSASLERAARYDGSEDTHAVTWLCLQRRVCRWKVTITGSREYVRGERCRDLALPQVASHVAVVHPGTRFDDWLLHELRPVEADSVAVPV